MEKKYDIFISYARSDFDEVNLIKQQIESQIPSIACWFDINGIESGDEFEEKIIQAIDASDYILFALSDHSLNSQWTKDEVMYAKNVGKKIIPLMLEGATLKGWFLFKFGRVDCIDTTNALQMEKLVRNLSKWCSLPIVEPEEAKKPVEEIEEESVEKVEKIEEESLEEDLVEKAEEIEEIIDAPALEPEPVALVEREEQEEVAEEELETVEEAEASGRLCLEQVEGSKESDEEFSDRLYRKLDSFLSKHPKVPYLIGLFFVVLFLVLGYLPQIVSDKADDAKIDLNVPVISEDESKADSIIAEAEPVNEFDQYGVDLGLSVIWADRNIGADSPQGEGEHYAWGEIEPGTYFSNKTCKAAGKKYEDISGNPEFDAAAYKWGGKWRMPTKAEFEELLSNCSYEKIKNGNSQYVEFTATNGNKIIIPFVNVRICESSSHLSPQHWTSTPHPTDSYCVYVFGRYNDDIAIDWLQKAWGLNIRPVRDK